MIKINSSVFELHTKNTSYIFRIMDSGHLEHLYYGNRIDTSYGIEPLILKEEFAPGNTLFYSKEHSFSMENRCFEVSGCGCSDTAEGMVRLVYSDGSSKTDFVYSSHKLNIEKTKLKGLPSSYANENDNYEELAVSLKEKNKNIVLELIFGVFYESDIITKNIKITNKEADFVIIDRLYSNQIDFNSEDFDVPYLINYTGGWANEMNASRHKLEPGSISGGSICGTSSSRNNPFVILSEEGTSEYYGKCIGFNLVYSGNHIETAALNSFGRIRFLQGINDYGFSWKLDANEEFYAPEAVMTYSSEGFSKLSKNMHYFINNNIVRGPWKNKERPVLINSWESYYMQFDEKKLIKLAKTAKETGIELFVLDDGWFSNRNDDTSSLGDWNVNTSKLPKGLSGLSNKLNEIGMDFGIWVEPEMVNENSDLYRTHPDWVLKLPYGEQSLGRNQMILDLGRKEVREFIIEFVSNIISEGNIKYIKWDMNRMMSDVYSGILPSDRQQEAAHRYILGLYEVLETLTLQYPNVLWESCASGGNRFDMGMLCFMQQIWASDNTDVSCRMLIQHGYSYGYPQSVIGAHVSASPNHQTLRNSPLDARFAAAVFGMLGYELNMCDLSSKELEEIKSQTAAYKEIRSWLVDADFYRSENRKFGSLDGRSDIYQWTIVSKDKKHAVHIYFKNYVKPDGKPERLDINGLDNDIVYELAVRETMEDVMDFGSLINTMSPVHIKQNSLFHQVAAKFVKLPSEKERFKVKGSVLNNGGVNIHQAYQGTGYNERVRVMKDFDARLYFIEACS